MMSGDAMRVKIEFLNVKGDERGCVFEPLEPESLPRQRNAHLVLTQPGCVRGNHYHANGTEVIVVHGSTLARFRDRQVLREITVGENQTVRFIIPNEVSHAFKNTGNSTTVMVAFNTVAHDKKKPDVVQDILIEK
jgi:UDP-2-acetamido-2,6-beta-L-arabino-hexul-4-ose reductase